MRSTPSLSSGPPTPALASSVRRRGGPLRGTVVTTAALLALTALVPVAGLTTPASLALLLLPALALVGLGVLAQQRSASRGPLRVQAALRPSLELVLHLSPVALLTLIFPIASARLSGVQVGGTPLTTLLLGSSLTVPWLGQAVCMPLYRALGVAIHEGDADRVGARFVEVWPAAFVQSLPALVVFAVPVQIALHWSPRATATYLALILLHLAFAQSLVPANIGRRRMLWAAAWTAYALALLLLPRVWFLPPLVGLLTQLVPLRRHASALRHLAVLDVADLVRDLRRGLLLGAVLWADKFLLFVRHGNDFPVTTIFLALLPSILAYNFYFVRLAPRFDRDVLTLRDAMEHERFGRLSDRSSQLAQTVVRSLAQTAFAGALLGLVVTLVVREVQPGSVGLVAAVSVASWLFMMTTIVSYKLDYVGRLDQAQWVGAAHLALCVAAFLVLPVGVPLYVVVLLGEAVLFAVTLRSCVRHWRTSEYALFWRHATAW